MLKYNSFFFIGFKRHWKLWLNINCLEGGTHCFPALSTLYEGWNFNSGNYLFTTDTK